MLNLKLYFENGGNTWNNNIPEWIKGLGLFAVLAGPFAGRMLSDLGADVVKVEPPDGDVTRLWGHVVAGLPGYYHQQNAGKRNVCIDLRNAQSKQLVLDLVPRRTS